MCVCLPLETAYLERAYQRDGIKDEDLKILLEHLDLAILSVGLFELLEPVHFFLKLRLSFCHLQSKRILMDVWPSFYIKCQSRDHLLLCLPKRRASLPSSPLNPPPLFWEKIFSSVQLCGSNRRCHCVSPSQPTVGSGMASDSSLLYLPFFNVFSPKVLGDDMGAIKIICNFLGDRSIFILFKSKRY